MPGLKTNEREGTRAVLRHYRMSPYKMREVLDLIRNKPVGEAEDILRFTDRDAAIPVRKLLHSAVANAENNESQDGEELYVSACFADEGPTIKRWRPRARGRATRIRKRTSHVTIIVSRLPEDQLTRLQARRQAEQAARRARRVAGARRAGTAAQAGGEDGRNRASRRRRRGAGDVEEPTAADVAAIEEEEGIVDEDAAAIAAAEEAEAESEGREEADAPQEDADAPQQDVADTGETASGEDTEKGKGTE
jgi:large subunit ribosomal protein L22